jgi:hypothetical protein
MPQTTEFKRHIGVTVKVGIGFNGANHMNAELPL